MGVGSINQQSDGETEEKKRETASGQGGNLPAPQHVHAGDVGLGSRRRGKLR
jgi:hypothetical protein